MGKDLYHMVWEILEMGSEPLASHIIDKTVICMISGVPAMYIPKAKAV